MQGMITTGKLKGEVGEISKPDNEGNLWFWPVTVKKPFRIKVKATLVKEIPYSLKDLT